MSLSDASGEPSLSPAEEEASTHRSRMLPLLAAYSGHAIWGFSYLFTKLALGYATPELLLSHRFLLAVFLMSLPLLTGRKQFSLRGKNWRPLLLLAATEPFCFYFESYGILYTNATFAGVVLAVVPVVSILLSAVFLREFPSRRQVLFCLLPIAGVVMITMAGSSLGIVRPIGVLLLAGSCLASASYRTVNRKAAEEFTSFERTYAVLLICSVVFTLAALRSTHWQVNSYLAPLAQPGFLLPLLILVLFCSIGSNLLINFAAGKMPVAKLSICGTITTVCSAFAGVVFLREPLTALSLVGSALIIIGVRQVTKS